LASNLSILRVDTFNVTPAGLPGFFWLPRLPPALGIDVGRAVGQEPFGACPGPLSEGVEGAWRLLRPVTVTFCCSRRGAGEKDVSATGGGGGDVDSGAFISGTAICTASKVPNLENFSSKAIKFISPVFATAYPTGWTRFQISPMYQYAAKSRRYCGVTRRHSMGARVSSASQISASMLARAG
jgi:hypothetical protein